MSENARGRRVNPTDLMGLYALVSLQPEAFPRVTARGLPPPHLFEAVFWRSVADARVVPISEAENARPVVAGVLYDVDYRNSTGWLEVGAEDGYGSEVADLARDLARAGFGNHGLRKIYRSVPAYADQDSALSFMHPIGSLPEHLLHEGLYWDLNFYEARPNDVHPDR